ncbi:MAG: hypothetical protein QNJ68_07210 [Microcoleaceae cyanobacterium MO_207.B10]|nr:hypothetical protein [Microcoleaceae cyanobacterium MO_207.B10]
MKNSLDGVGKPKLPNCISIPCGIKSIGFAKKVIGVRFSGQWLVLISY